MAAAMTWPYANTLTKLDMRDMKKILILVVVAGAGLAGCGGKNDSATSGTSVGQSVTMAVPAAFFGNWVNDQPKRTPPDPVPDHYDRTEYEIAKEGSNVTLTEWSAALDIKTKKQWFRNRIRGPIPCTYIPDRECLACGKMEPVVSDSLFIVNGRLENRTPAAFNPSAPVGGRLVLTRKPDQTDDTL